VKIGVTRALDEVIGHSVVAIPAIDVVVVLVVTT
jgi:hypothetical protein